MPKAGGAPPRDITSLLTKRVGPSPNALLSRGLWEIDLFNGIPVGSKERPFIDFQPARVKETVNTYIELKVYRHVRELRELWELIVKCMEEAKVKL